jgi:hypothetical protein
MSGTGPRGRKVGREQVVKRVRNPEGETNRGWTPGPVDLPALVVEGKRKPMRGVPKPRRTSAEKVKCTLKGSPSLWKFPVLRHRVASFETPRGRKNGEAGAVNQIAAT